MSQQPIDRCPACRSEVVREVRSSLWDKVGLSRCESCGSEFLNPQPSDSRLEEIYSPTYYQPWSYESSDVVRATKQLTFEPALAATNLAPGARLLDVGCGTGDLLALASARGLEAYGVDLNELAIERARDTVPDARLHRGVLDDKPFPSVTFDAITMFDFIEHARDPEQEIRAAAARLAPGGRLVISTPRVDSVTRRLTGRSWPQYREEHLTYFSANGIHALMQRVGMVITRLTSTKKVLTPSYLYGQAVNYPVAVVTPLVKATWRFLPVPKHRPLSLRFGEMTVLAHRRDDTDL